MNSHTPSLSSDVLGSSLSGEGAAARVRGWLDEVCARIDHAREVSVDEWQALQRSVAGTVSDSGLERSIRDFLSRTGLAQGLEESTGQDAAAHAQALARDYRRRVLAHGQSTSIENYAAYLGDVPQIRL